MIPSISPQTHTPHTYAHYVPSEVQSTSLYYQDTNKAPPVHIGAFWCDLFIFCNSESQRILSLSRLRCFADQSVSFLGALESLWLSKLWPIILNHLNNPGFSKTSRLLNHNSDLNFNLTRSGQNVSLCSLYATNAI